MQTPSGLRYTDFRLGGGAPVQRNYLLVLHFTCADPFVHSLLTCVSSRGRRTVQDSLERHCISYAQLCQCCKQASLACHSCTAEHKPADNCQRGWPVGVQT